MNRIIFEAFEDFSWTRVLIASAVGMLIVVATVIKVMVILNA